MLLVLVSLVGYNNRIYMDDYCGLGTCGIKITKIKW